jgi:multisubunit Na+/H+ antiporter MnhB subunit
MLGDILTRAGGIAILGMVVSLAPLFTGVLYAWRPSERRLALMRPLSLAAIFAGLCTLLSGLAHVFQGLSDTQAWTDAKLHVMAAGLAETVTPLFVAFGFLTVAWLCVAAGIRRS